MLRLPPMRLILRRPSGAFARRAALLLIVAAAGLVPVGSQAADAAAGADPAAGAYAEHLCGWY